MILNGESVHIVYMDATKGWVPDLMMELSLDEVPQTYDIDILVVAGGGSGGRCK